MPQGVFSGLRSGRADDQMAFVLPIRDPNINWLLHRGYQVLSKGKSGKRAAAFARQVHHWHQLDEGKWIAPAPPHLCHRYYRRTQTVTLRWYKEKISQFKYGLLICSLLDYDLIGIGSEFFAAIMPTLFFSMLGDCADYSEWQNDRRATGLITPRGPLLIKPVAVLPAL
jgi:hypothetical protein